jgi:hypothetical protein
MSHWGHLIHHCANAAKEARDKGESSKASGFMLIALGVFLLWIPIIGIPLIVYGFIRLLK